MLRGLNIHVSFLALCYMESRTKLEEDPKEIPQARLSYEYVEITK
jgi:hypothetical protein